MITRSSLYISSGKHLLRLALAALFLFTVLACGDEGSLGTGDPPTFEASPSTIAFAQVNLGEVAQSSVTISNTGTGPLQLRDIKIAPASGGSAAAFSAGSDWPSSREIEIGPGEFTVLTVVYAPTQEVDYRATLQMGTNVPDLPTAQIPITTLGLAPELFSPRPLSFSRTPAGTSEWQLTEIDNIGAAPLVIEHIFVNQGAPFEVTFPGDMQVDQDGNLIYPPASEDSNSPPVTTLRPGDRPILMRIWFHPENDDPASGELTISSNDPRNPDYVITLTGNSGSSCLEVTPDDELDFHLATIGETTFRTVTMRNCAPGTDLEISNLSITDDGGGVFAIRENSYPGNLPGETLVLGPQDTANVVIGYSPTDESASVGELLITSDDGFNPQLRLPILGQGTTHQCPIAQAAARDEGATQWNQSITTTPPSAISLSSEGSSNPDGGGLTYEWAVISRPAGSFAQISPSATAANPSFQVDIAGIYEIELTTFNPVGMASCETSVVEIISTPGGDIHVELTWTVPSSPNNRGTDLDLHYLHQHGTWGSSDYSVNWRTKVKGWDGGEIRLDIDSRDGARPENVKHTNPTDGIAYIVGIHYYFDFGFGASDATLRVYINGLLEYERINHRIHNNKDLWDAIGIVWGATPQIVERGALLTNMNL